MVETTGESMEGGEDGREGGYAHSIRSAITAWRRLLEKLGGEEGEIKVEKMGEGGGGMCSIRSAVTAYIRVEGFRV